MERSIERTRTMREKITQAYDVFMERLLAVKLTNMYTAFSIYISVAIIANVFTVAYCAYNTTNLQNLRFGSVALFFISVITLIGVSPFWNYVNKEKLQKKIHLYYSPATKLAKRRYKAARQLVTMIHILPFPIFLASAILSCYYAMVWWINHSN